MERADKADKVCLEKKLQLIREQEQVLPEDDIESVNSKSKHSRTEELVRSTSEVPAQELPEVKTAAGQKDQLRPKSSSRRLMLLI